MSAVPSGRQPRADALVLFGATGDLAKRKLFPALYHMEDRGELERAGRSASPAATGPTTSSARRRRRRSRRPCRRSKKTVLQRLVKRLDLVQGDYADTTTWAALTDVLDKHRSQDGGVLHGDPADDVPDRGRVAGVGRAQRAWPDRRREAVRRDLRSAHELNVVLHKVFPENHIFRIDHYLGKESVEDLLVFRFSNTLLEPVWNRRYVRSVQITMSETIGVEGRGSFYDSVGAIRDVFQNHLLQVVSLLAMEPPVGHEAQLPAGREGQGVRRDEGARLHDAGARPVRGLPRRGRASPRDSKTETFVAAKLEIDSWRWAGVPWYARVGKALAPGGHRGGDRVAVAAAAAVRRGGRTDPGAQPHPPAPRQARRRDVLAAGEDARPAPRQPVDERVGRLRRRPRRPSRGLRAPARRRPRRLAPPLRPRGRRRADVAHRRARAQAENCGPVYRYAVGSWGPEGGRPHPPRRRPPGSRRVDGQPTAREHVAVYLPPMSSGTVRTGVGQSATAAFASVSRSGPRPRLRLATCMSFGSTWPRAPQLAALRRACSTSRASYPATPIGGASLVRIRASARSCFGVRTSEIYVLDEVYGMRLYDRVATLMCRRHGLDGGRSGCRCRRCSPYVLHDNGAPCVRCSRPNNDCFARLEGERFVRINLDDRVSFVQRRQVSDKPRRGALTARSRRHDRQHRGDGREDHALRLTGASTSPPSI